MARKDYTPEQAIGMLREAEVRLSQGEKIGKICRRLGISEQTYDRWRRLYGGLKIDQAWRLKDLERENQRLKKAISELTDAGQADPEGGPRGKILSPSRKRACVEHARSRLPVSERRTCAVVGQPRATQHRRPQVRDDEAALTSAVERLATQYGRYGYRRIRRPLVDEGRRVNVKRVWWIWRRRGLKCRANNRRGAVYGSTTARACACGLSGPTTSGPTTSCRIGRRMAARSACCA
jgi:putative transposase